jgi:hypothetical protein
MLPGVAETSYRALVFVRCCGRVITFRVSVLLAWIQPEPIREVDRIPIGIPVEVEPPGDADRILLGERLIGAGRPTRH